MNKKLLLEINTIWRGNKVRWIRKLLIEINTILRGNKVK